MTQELSEAERKDIMATLEKQDTETLRAICEALMMVMRAVNGLPPEPSDIISKLLNVKNPMERSRFPTYPILQKQVYLRLIATVYGEPAKICAEWADFDASALIQYKGEGRKEWVEATRAQVVGAENQSFIMGGLQAQQERRGLLRRGRNVNKEASEFESE